MSTTPEMRAEAGVLRLAANLVDQAQADFNSLAADLDSRITGMRAQWQGSGGLAFANLQQAWQEKQRVIVGALTDFETALIGTDQANLATDDDQASINAGLTTALGDLPTGR